MEEGIIQERPDEMALCGSEGKKSFLLSALSAHLSCTL